MRLLPFSLVALALAACAAPEDEQPATESDALQGNGLTRISSFGKNPGALDMFEHVPANLSANAPVVVILHGCLTTAPDIAATGWNDLADTRGFIAVYPQQSFLNNGTYCFNWANAMGFANDDAKRGGGESESIREMTLNAIRRHHGDPSRVYVAGFSAGAAMAVNLAAVYPDLYAGAASFAGVPYGCAGTLPESIQCMIPGIERTAAEHARRVTDAFPGYSGRRPRISIWQGGLDNVVYPRNQSELTKQWTTLHQVALEPSVVDTVDGQPHAVWLDASHTKVIETYRLEDMWHGLPVDPSNGCGKASTFAPAQGICGASRVADFFEL